MVLPTPGCFLLASSLVLRVAWAAFELMPYPLRWTRLDDLQPKENGVCQAPRTTEARELKAYVDDEALSPGEIVGNGYVLQELLQGLGVTGEEEAADYYIQDFAFHVPGRVDKPRLLEDGPTDSPTFVPVEPVWVDEEEEGVVVEDRALAMGVPVGESSSLKEYARSANLHRERFYKLGRKFEGGGHGEIWRAFKVLEDGHTLSEERFVMKRMLVEGKMDIWRCGLREIYFGKKLTGQPHIARYVEHFYRNTTQAGVELWIVYHDEGLSLRKYLYTPTRADGAMFYEPSEFWRRLRLSDAGGEVLRVLLRQIFEGLAVLHAKNITHRDLKPSNIILSLSSGQAVLKVADFSSAVDPEAIRSGLYGIFGPTQDEETKEYMPPEATFNGSIPYFKEDSKTYDSWSIGVIFLEILLGTPHVFTVDQRTRAILCHQLRNEKESVRRRALLLAAMADFCIHTPEAPSYHVTPRALARGRGGKVECTLEDLRKALQQRDPLDKGFSDKWGLHLLSRLLQWDPRQRIGPQEALQHAFFKGPYVSTIDGSEHATPRELQEYEACMSKRIHTKKDPDAKAVVDAVRSSVVSERSSDVPRNFTCPACHRVFDTWHSCHAHAVGRGHGRFCHYDTRGLPSCAGSHSMLPLDPYSGWCDIQGRREVIEDFHAIVFSEDFKFYSVMDGHWGTKAAKFASKALHSNIEVFMELGQDVGQAMRGAFLKTHRDFVQLTRGRDKSGTTATCAVLFPDTLVVGNVGDSRAILCCDEEGKPVQLTVDHTASLPEERARVEALGGKVVFKGCWRVGGELALTRSVGDLSYDKYLSREPHVVVHELRPSDQFMVLASDGLWDVMTNEDVVEMVQQILAEMAEEDDEREEDGAGAGTGWDVAGAGGPDYHVIARLLTLEAFVRGSRDNIGACVVDLRQHPESNHGGPTRSELPRRS